MFTAIAAFDIVEDATGTVGTVLHWSTVMEVLDYEEYVGEYNLYITIEWSKSNSLTSELIEIINAHCLNLVGQPMQSAN